MNPKLSIITINLNNAIGLQKTIKSVVNQLFKDYEFIIIDGKSTDNSIDIIKQYSDKITYWVSEPDKGIYNAMNKGIIQARGEYCHFLNSGDFFVDGILSKIFDSLYADDIIYGNRISYDNSDQKEIKSPMSLSMLNFFHSSICHQATFIKRVLFEKYGLYDESLKNVSDWKFFLQAIIFNNCSTRYIDTNIAYVDATGISSTQYAISRRERESIQNEYIPRFVPDYILLKNIVNSDFYKVYVYTNKKRFFKFIFLIIKHLIKFKI